LVTSSHTARHATDLLLFVLIPRPLRSTLFPYTTLFRSRGERESERDGRARVVHQIGDGEHRGDRHQREEELHEHGAEQTNYSGRSEEHTSELQSRENLVCRLLLEKKKRKNNKRMRHSTG